MAVVTKTEGGVTIEVSVRPRAGRCRVVRVVGDRLKIEVTAPPEGGRASKQVLDTVAEALGVRQSQASLLIGKRDRHKTVRVDGITVSEASAALGVDAVVAESERK